MVTVSSDTMNMFFKARDRAAEREAQRARVAQFERDRLALGEKKAPPMSVPISKPVIKAVLAPQKPVAKKSSKDKWLLQTFVNEFGQHIQVGSKVVATKSGYNHSIKVSLATYLGLHLDANGKVTSVVIQDLKTGTRSALPTKRIYPTV